MRKFIAVTALLFVCSAVAEELKFGDLNYFLKQGQKNLTVNALSNKETSKSAAAGDIDVDAFLFNSSLGYGLTDHLNFVVGLDYLFDGETSIAKGASADASGVQNPKFGVNYRVKNQNSDDFNLDFGALATVNVMDREVATVNKDGNTLNPLYSNYGEPRSSLDLNARLGKKWDIANEFYVSAGFAYFMDGDYKQLEGNTVDMDSSIDLKLGAFYQYRPVHEFMMTLGLMGTRKGEMDGEDGSNAFTVTDHIDYKFIFNAKYLITENLIGKFLFAQDNRGDFDYESDSGNVEYNKRNSLQYGLGIDWLF